MSSEEPSHHVTFPGIFLGGLRGDMPPSQLAGLITQLLCNYQEVPKENVDVHIVSTDYAYAIVDLKDETQKQQLLDSLASLDNVLTIFDLSAITNDLGKFRVAEKTSRSNSRHRSKSKSRRSKDGAEASGSPPGTRPGSASHPGKRSRPNSGERPAGHFSEFHKQCIPDMKWMRSPKPGHRSRSKRRRRRKRKLEDRPSFSSLPDAEMERLKAAMTSESTSETEEEIPPKIQQAESEASISEEEIPRAGKIRCSIYESTVDPLKKHQTTEELMGRATSRKVDTADLESPLLFRNACAATSTVGQKEGLPINFFSQGEVIGRESRTMEFKEGANRGQLQEKVGKYVCGFLNSGEGGTLYFGVDDQGGVKGISCPRAKEDDFRLLIDSAIKKFNPPIFTDAYSVHFIPIMKENGKLSDQMQVLAIDVKPQQNLQQLFDFNGDAFLRRDGSLQGPLKAVQIQEWMRQNISKQQQQAGSNYDLRLVERLDQMSAQLREEKERNEALHQKLENLQQAISKPSPKPQKQSKMCVVM